MAKVPKCWKEALIHPLHKKKSKQSIQNYRPVSILSTPSKVLEAVVRKQMSQQMERLGIIPSSQHGFRSGRSTTTTVASLEYDLKHARSKKKASGALFLDLSAAFDTIDKEILAKKLTIYGATDRVVRWIRSYLSDRSQCVIYRQHKSNVRLNDTGAPQGSILSPFLFLVLVSDMEECVTDMECVRLISYADDTTIYAWGDTASEVYQKLSEAGKRILTYMRLSGLAANAEKTNFVMFGSGMGPITIGDVQVQQNKEEKLVGVWLSKCLSWEKNLQEVESCLRQRIGLLRRLSWHLPKETMLKCITHLFTSKLTFGLELMTDPLKHQDKNEPNCAVITRLQKLLNEAVRASLRIRRSERVSELELMRRSGQLTVCSMAARAIANHAWNSFSTQWRRDYSELTKRIEWGQRGRTTRQSDQEIVPPQSVKECLVSRVGQMWNSLPVEIKTESNKKKAMAKIKALFRPIP